MSDKGNNKVIIGLLALLAVMIVILAAAVGVKLSGVGQNRDDQAENDSGMVSKMPDDKAVGEMENMAVDEGPDEAVEIMDGGEDDEVKKAAVGAGNDGIEKTVAGTANGYTGEEDVNTGSRCNGRKDMFTAADYPADEELREALTAYQEYVDGNDGMYFDGYLLAYLDEDDIPELIAVGDCEAAGQLIITYRDGKLFENGVGRLGGLKYAKKQNFYYNSNGNMGSYRDEFFQLVNGEQIVIMSGYWGDKRDEDGKIILNAAGDYPEQEYVWNGTVCSEEEYYDAMDEFIRETVGDAELIKVDGYGDDLYDNIPEAYEGLKYRKYGTYWPYIHAFALENGILTFSVGDGGHYGWGSSEDILYTVSYPVAEDCIWEDRGRGVGEHYQLEVADTDYIRDTSFEEIKERIDTEQRLFDEAVSALGRDKARVESPISVVVVVKEDVVVRVYTVSS